MALTVTGARGNVTGSFSVGADSSEINYIAVFTTDATADKIAEITATVSLSMPDIATVDEIQASVFSPTPFTAAVNPNFLVSGNSKVLVAGAVAKAGATTNGPTLGFWTLDVRLGPSTAFRIGTFIANDDASAQTISWTVEYTVTYKGAT